MPVINVVTKMEINASAAAGWKLFGEDFADHCKWVSKIVQPLEGDLAAVMSPSPYCACWVRFESEKKCT